jgi:hypothetical protein
MVDLNYRGGEERRRRADRRRRGLRCECYAPLAFVQHSQLTLRRTIAHIVVCLGISSGATDSRRVVSSLTIVVPTLGDETMATAADGVKSIMLGGMEGLVARRLHSRGKLAVWV